MISVAMLTEDAIDTNADSMIMMGFKFLIFVTHGTESSARFQRQDQNAILLMDFKA